MKKPEQKPMTNVDETVLEEEEAKELTSHHQATGTTSVKKPDQTPPIRPGRINNPDKLDHPPIRGTGGNREGIGYPDHQLTGPQETLEIDGIITKNPPKPSEEEEEDKG